MQLDQTSRKQFQKRFTIRSLLGKGSFGSVYECEDNNNKQIYAVKVIGKKSVKKSKIACLREQAELLRNLNHQNIVKIYQFVQDDWFILLKMELMRFGTLNQLMKKRQEEHKKFTDEQISTIMRCLLNSVKHIHEASIIHRDIKPQNILLCQQNQVDRLKLADFGLGTKLDSHYPKSAITKCGTMLFMAPQILCNYTYTKAIDIWSCATIMFMLYMGKHPLYQPKMTPQKYKQIIKTNKFAKLPNQLAENFITKISKIQYSQRYTAQQALKHPWITRRTNDEIPLSLHESYCAFQKSHEISQFIKIALITKKICINDTSLQVPVTYRLKIKQQKSCLQSKRIKPSHIVNINSLRDISDLEIESTKPKRKKSYELQGDSPVIVKLNQIFKNLFDRKTSPRKIQIQDSTLQQNSPFKQTIIDFKDALQHDIQQLVSNMLDNKKKIKRRIFIKKNIYNNKNVALNKIDDNKINYNNCNSARSNSCSAGTNSNNLVRYRRKSGTKL